MNQIQQLIKETENCDLIFPTHLRASLNTYYVIDENDPHINAVVKAIQAEPVLAARCLSIVNSVVFNRNGKPIYDIKTAVVRLGIRNIKILATTVLIKQMIVKTVYAEIAAKLWQHSVNVATIAQSLAPLVPTVNSSTALFAGLMHDIGGFYILSRLTDYPNLLIDPVLSENEKAINIAVMKALRIPGELMLAISNSFLNEPHTPIKSLSDIIYVANCLSPVSNPLPFSSGKNPEDVSLAKLLVKDPIYVNLITAEPDILIA